MIELDGKDHAIIKALREDSRLSIRQIAKKTRLRPSTVHKRMERLKRDNVIEKFTLKLNNKIIGEDFIVFMYVSTSEDLPIAFFHNQHVKEAFGITGEYDLLLKLKFKDVSAFNDYIISIRKNKTITKTITHIATINIKEEI